MSQNLVSATFFFVLLFYLSLQGTGITNRGAKFSSCLGFVPRGDGNFFWGGGALGGQYSSGMLGTATAKTYRAVQLMVHRVSSNTLAKRPRLGVAIVGAIADLVPLAARLVPLLPACHCWFCPSFAPITDTHKNFTAPKSVPAINELTCAFC